MFNVNQEINNDFINYWLKPFNEDEKEWFWKYLNLAYKYNNYCSYNFNPPTLTILFGNQTLLIRPYGKKFNIYKTDLDLKRKKLTFEELKELYPKVEESLRNLEPTQVPEPKDYDLNTATKILETFGFTTDFLNKLKKIDVKDALIFLAKQNTPVKELQDYYKKLVKEEGCDMPDITRLTRFELLMYKAIFEVGFVPDAVTFQLDNDYDLTDILGNYIIFYYQLPYRFDCYFKKSKTVVDFLSLAIIRKDSIYELLRSALGYYDTDQILSKLVLIVKAIQDNDLTELLETDLKYLVLLPLKELRKVHKVIPLLKYVKNGTEILNKTLEDDNSYDHFNQNLMKNITISLLDLKEDYTWEEHFYY